MEYNYLSLFEMPASSDKVLISGNQVDKADVGRSVISCFILQLITTLFVCTTTVIVYWVYGKLH